MKRAFKGVDPVSVFRRFLEKPSQKVESDPRSESHEWFSPINLKQLWGNKDILLSDNTLRIRSIVDVEVVGPPEIRMSRSQYVPIGLGRPNQNLAWETRGRPEHEGTIPGEEKSLRKTRTHISEHSIFNGHIVQYSNHSPFGSETFGSRRAQTAQNWYPQDKKSDVDSDTSYCIPQKVEPVRRPHTSVEIRRLDSKGLFEETKSSGTLKHKGPAPALPPRPGTRRLKAEVTEPYHRESFSDGAASGGGSSRRRSNAGIDLQIPSVLQIRNFSKMHSDSNCNLAVVAAPQMYPRPTTATFYTYQDPEDAPQGVVQLRPTSARPEMTQSRLEKDKDSDSETSSEEISIIKPKVETESWQRRPLPSRPQTTKPGVLYQYMDGSRDLDRPTQRPQTAQPKRIHTAAPIRRVPEHRGLDISNTDCAIICGNKKFNVHSVILKGRGSYPT